MKKLIIIFVVVITNTMAMTPDAEKGKALITICNACHSDNIAPPLAPPFYAVQTRYYKEYDNKQNFIKAIVDWVKKPTLEKALMKHPVKKLGLMPAMPLSNEMLSKIGAYLYEQKFEPPCNHWSEILKHSDSSNTEHNNHDAMVRMKYNQLCR